MLAVGRLGSYITRGVYTVSGSFHPFGGAVDIIVVEQPDGSLKSSPWYVRFGKFQGVLKAKEKVVNINVNGVDTNLHMYLDQRGEAYFLREVDGDEEDSIYYRSFSSDEGQSDVGNGQIVARTSSQKSRILGLVFGRKSIKEKRVDVRTASLERAEIAADLLDVKWSTNLASSRLQRNESVSWVSAPGTPSCDHNKIEEIDLMLNEEIDTLDNRIGTRSRLGLEMGTSDKDFGVEMSCLKTTRIIETSILAESDTENADHDEHALEIHDVFLPCNDVSEEKRGGGETIHTFHNAETSPNSLDDGPVTETCTQLMKIDSRNVSVQEVETCAVSTISGFDGLTSEVEGGENMRGKDNMNEVHSSSNVEVLEEEQLLFGDIDDLSDGNNQDVVSVVSTRPSVSREGSEAALDSCSAYVDFTQENMENGVEYSRQKSRIVSDHIDIPISDNKLAGEDIRMVGSLPDLWTPIDDLSVGNIRRHSLDSNSESPRWIPLRDDVSMAIEPDFDNEGHSSQPQASVGKLSKSVDSSNAGWGWPFSLRRSKSTEPTQPAQSSEESPIAENSLESSTAMDDEKNVLKPKANKKEVKAFAPTPEQLAALNLKEGMNTVVFTFSTSIVGTQQVDARIYLWKWNTRIVISDVDGTITKSDVLGQFMPLVGMDWSQTGVTRLFSAIKENGYELLFLSARAVSQASITRQFLFNLKQNGKALPDGPVVISPDGLFPSLFREVIRRAPHEFKISCLEDIKACFPADCNPFYAGFGNRDTDEISYLKVGIPKGKIFIINPKGEVAVHRRVDTKSYSSLHDLVHDMFPPKSSSEQEDFNSWNFWRLPPPGIEY